MTEKTIIENYQEVANLHNQMIAKLEQMLQLKTNQVNEAINRQSKDEALIQSQRDYIAALEAKNNTQESLIKTMEKLAALKEMISVLVSR